MDAMDLYYLLIYFSVVFLVCNQKYYDAIFESREAIYEIYEKELAEEYFQETGKEYDGEVVLIKDVKHMVSWKSYLKWDAAGY